MLRDDDKANDDLLTLDYRACPALTHAPRSASAARRPRHSPRGRAGSRGWSSSQNRPPSASRRMRGRRRTLGSSLSTASLGSASESLTTTVRRSKRRNWGPTTPAAAGDVGALLPGTAGMYAWQSTLMSGSWTGSSLAICSDGPAFSLTLFSTPARRRARCSPLLGNGPRGTRQSTTCTTPTTKARRRALPSA